MSFRAAVPEDEERLSELRTQAFNSPALVGGNVDGFRVVESDGRIDGAMRFTPVGQWFGGRAVPAAAVTSVMVAAEARGRGVGATLMTEALREMRESGIAVSTLYPSTLPTYRKVGYELAGIR